MGNLSSNPLPELRDLTGCVTVVTGGNTGIGYSTVLHLARCGAKVYLGARNEAKARAAIEKLQAEGLGPRQGEVVWLDVDLTYPRKAKEAAEFILSREQRLDILINNASKQALPYVRTSDGLSDSMAINHLSPFLFTITLLPLLTSTAWLPDADVRIVNITSTMYSWAKNPRFDSIEAINSDFHSDYGWFSSPRMQLYSYTKLANILHAKELQKRLDAENVPIIVTSVHPGLVFTGKSSSLRRQ
jgi:NAD(P)-dependent dehydrogenase (short-subunit alcohol dehydrogenase family)